MWKVKLWRTYVKTDNDGFTFDILFFLSKSNVETDEIQSYLIKKNSPLFLRSLFLDNSSAEFLARVGYN